MHAPLLMTFGSDQTLAAGVRLPPPRLFKQRSGRTIGSHSKSVNRAVVIQLSTCDTDDTDKGSGIQRNRQQDACASRLDLRVLEGGFIASADLVFEER